MNIHDTICKCDDCEMTEDEVYAREELESIVEENDDGVDKNFFIEY